MTRTFVAIATAIAAVWLGMLIGISFVATPVKFTAPAIEFGPALDVGRVTFALFSRLEWGLAAVTAIAVFASAPPRSLTVAALLPVAIVVVQSAWLLPVLDARVQAILDAQRLPPSWEHGAYGALEVLKALILLFVVGAGFRRLHATPPKAG